MHTCFSYLHTFLWCKNGTVGKYYANNAQNVTKQIPLPSWCICLSGGVHFYILHIHDICLYHAIIAFHNKAPWTAFRKIKSLAPGGCNRNFGLFIVIPISMISIYSQILFLVLKVSFLRHYEFWFAPILFSYIVFMYDNNAILRSKKSNVIYEAWALKWTQLIFGFVICC